MSNTTSFEQARGGDSRSVSEDWICVPRNVQDTDALLRAVSRR